MSRQRTKHMAGPDHDQAAKALRAAVLVSSPLTKLLVFGETVYFGGVDYNDSQRGHSRRAAGDHEHDLPRI